MRIIFTYFFLSAFIYVINGQPAFATPDLEGHLEYQIADDFSGNSVARTYFLVTTSGTRIPLSLEESESTLRSHIGDFVRIRPHSTSRALSGNALSWRDFEVTRISTQAYSVLGKHSVLLINVNFTGYNPTFDLPTIHSILVSGPRNLKHVFELNSRNAFTMDLDRNQDGGPDSISINLPPFASCTSKSLDDLSSQADQLALAQGFNAALYDHIIYFVPTVGSFDCPFGGRADFLGNRVWVAQLSSFTVAHELGHNLGLDHSSRDSDRNGELDGSFQSEYGDESCLMGFTFFTQHFNAPQTMNLGWLGGSFGGVETIYKPGTYDYRLSVLDSDLLKAGDLNAIIVNSPRSPDPRKNLVVSYRQGILEEDDGPCWWESFSGRTSVHFNTDQFQKSLLLGNAADGESVVDQLSTIRVTQISHSATEALVRIVIPVFGDADGDGLKDGNDDDADNDTVLNTADCAPLDSTRWSNIGYADGDYDNIANSTVPQTIECHGTRPLCDEGAGYFAFSPTPLDNCPESRNSDQADMDADGVGDVCDIDLDGDGVDNFSDCAKANSGAWRTVARAFADEDHDGINDLLAFERDTGLCFGNVPPPGYTDSSIHDNCIGTPNPDQKDSDKDTRGDACDLDYMDTDGDGVVDAKDCEPEDKAKWRRQAYLDTDGDGFQDYRDSTQVPCYGSTLPPGYLTDKTAIDNCLKTANPDQLDTDGDGYGDVCDSQPTKPNSPNDQCPNDPTKSEPGKCGCGIKEAYIIANGVTDCQVVEKFLNELSQAVAIGKQFLSTKKPGNRKSTLSKLKANVHPFILTTRNWILPQSMSSSELNGLILKANSILRQIKISGKTSLSKMRSLLKIFENVRRQLLT